jgi:3-deoxy-manno-octulosonate cytidylyltransferase (CMP-KDO synthetase)
MAIFELRLKFIESDISCHRCSSFTAALQLRCVPRERSVRSLHHVLARNRAQDTDLAPRKLALEWNNLYFTGHFPNRAHHDRLLRHLGVRMKTIAVIPARLASTRLPRKMLRPIAGEPLLGLVQRAVRASQLLEDVIIATDSEEIMNLCRQRGWNARMTSPTHRNGTERVHEIAQSIAADVYLLIQGDEPLTRPEHIHALLQVMNNGLVQVGTLKVVARPEDLDNPHAVKVVTDSSGRALYFSRATIPFDRDHTQAALYYKHLGFYAYRKPALDRFVAWPESNLERIERLEQLRFLENGVPIYVRETQFDTVGVDTEEDVKRVEAILKAPKG